MSQDLAWFAPSCDAENAVAADDDVDADALAQLQSALTGLRAGASDAVASGLNGGCDVISNNADVGPAAINSGQATANAVDRSDAALGHAAAPCSNSSVGTQPVHIDGPNSSARLQGEDVAGQPQAVTMPR